MVAPSLVVTTDRVSQRLQTQSVRRTTFPWNLTRQRVRYTDSIMRLQVAPESGQLAFSIIRLISKSNADPAVLAFSDGGHTVYRLADCRQWQCLYF